MTTVVLGWDGLDYDLAYEYGLADRFGIENTRLETFENPVIGKPHTYEVWPSIVTGLPADQHGVHAEEYTHGGNWESPVLNVAAVASKYVVPERLRWAVGRRIRDRGAEFAFESLDYYRDRGVSTVFDGRQSFPLAIPNVRSRHDDQLGITTDRGAALAEYMDIETGGDGETVHVPNVGLEAFAQRLEGDLGEKLGVVRQAIRWEYDLVFVWLGYLDTVGHVAPTVDDPEGWVRDGYETAAEWTDYIAETVISSGGSLVCLSDHGLKDGLHTSDAFFGWWRQEPDLLPDTVFDVAETLDTVTPRSERRDGPHSASERNADFEDVNQQLKHLGYVD